MRTHYLKIRPAKTLAQHFAQPAMCQEGQDDHDEFVVVPGFAKLTMDGAGDGPRHATAGTAALENEAREADWRMGLKPGGRHQEEK